MAERRMFHAAVVESDAFLDLPMGAQALYFHLGMHADDDGFVNGPKQIVRKLRRRADELRALIDAGFLLEFDGVVVLRHWRMANYLRSDRMKATNYPQIAAQLFVKANREYTLENEGFFPTLLELRQPILTTKCPPNIREDKIREENIKEMNINHDSVDGDYSETMAYVRQLLNRPNETEEYL